jgi:hypothetical protein
MEKSDRLELAELYLRGCLDLLRQVQEEKDGAGEVNGVTLMNAIESISDFLNLPHEHKWINTADDRGQICSICEADKRP